MRLGRGVLPAVLALGLAATACGSGNTSATADTAASEASTTTTATPPTTTTQPPPPGGRRPTPRDPLRVLMAGDSLMHDVSPALLAALNDGGSAVARFVAAPSIPREDVTRALWRQQLREYDPEAIVVMIGVWEGMGIDAQAQQPIGTPAWERAYRDQLLDPYLELLTSRGAEVVWIGMPPSPDLRRSLEFAALNRAVRRASRDTPGLTYIPGDELLSHPDGSWAEILPGPRGTPQRVRRVDTTHLCAEGSVRLARPVLDHLERQWDVPVARNWPTKNWRWVFPPEECPPAPH